ncbi:DUF2914 domain-containing protein [Pseudoalteromonas sp. S16_S37]|uniref:DUF2914 domain-containing protein n=1 Tax=Pseudoalteromonas sp. S16_S37 TaxID=2720228 RepID=UPI001680C63F|nr:DUF2914 domain-containing protein [Pseudoalteromonas sp. S16_S37]MBD1582689.1 DUF2914 domain-containing protein [Pseudoalteromonas sp. S16_S37]
MTQRIVIKTSVNKAPTANASVSYQWHWRRIFMACSVVLLFASALIYGLMNSVNADEIQAVEDSSIQSGSIQSGSIQSGTTHVSAVDEAQKEALVSPDVEAVESTLENTIEQQHAEQIAAQNQLTEKPVLVAINDITTSSSAKQSNIDEQPTHQDVDEQIDGVQSELHSENTFSEDATITNVALGAQIDSNLVSRAVLTTGIVDREPVDVLKENLELSQFTDKLFFFTEINNMQGQTVQHLWFHQDQLMAEIPLTISAIRFRTYSSKNIMPSQTGPWRVEVVTDQGQLLAQKSFRIISEAE